MDVEHRDAVNFAAAEFVRRAVTEVLKAEGNFLNPRVCPECRQKQRGRSEKLPTRHHAQVSQTTAILWCVRIAMGTFLRIAMASLWVAAGAPAQQNAFATHCAGCHGEDATGTGKAPALANNPRVAEQSAEQLRAYLQHGNPGAGMPSFADLTPDEISSVARFLPRPTAVARRMELVF